LKEQPHDTDKLRARRRPQRQWGRAEIEPPQRTPSRAAVAAATALLPAAPPAVPSHGRTIDVALIIARAVVVASAAFIATAIVLAISKVRRVAGGGRCRHDNEEVHHDARKARLDDAAALL
jgi:hypothetical protein